MTSGKSMHPHSRRVIIWFESLRQLLSNKRVFSSHRNLQRDLSVVGEPPQVGSEISRSLEIGVSKTHLSQPSCTPKNSFNTV